MSFQQAARWQATLRWPDDREFPFAAFSYYEADWSFGAGDATFRCAGIRVCSDRYCLKMSCVKLSRDILIELWYDPLVYAEREIQRLASQYVTLIESASASPDSRIRDLKVVSESERYELVYTLNATERSFPAMSLESAFGQRVEETPDSIALLFDNHQITYSELLRRANGLARHLGALGAGPETRVALCLERSPDAIIGMLAVLKAGAAYVPVDPNTLASARDTCLRTQRLLCSLRIAL